MANQNPVGIPALKRKIREGEANEYDYIRLNAHYLSKLQLESAIDFSRQCIKKFKKRHQTFYENLGIAEHLAGNSAGAIEAFRGGKGCGFGDSAGGLYPALLMWYVAVVSQDWQVVQEAREWIKEQLKLPMAKNWRGPIGRYILGQMSEEELINKAQDFGAEPGMSRQTREATFYIAIKALEENKRDQSISLLKAATKLAPDIGDDTLRLARHELRTLTRRK